jgi:fructokinase
MPNPILCVGEVLWDAMPDGLFLGGAPYNVACHLRRLGQPAALVSRVGDDVLGREVLRRLEANDLGTDHVQVDPEIPTGFARVDVDAEGIPAYEIVRPAAWDAIALDDALRDAAAEARAIVFGSLAQRAETSRRTVRALSTAGALAVFDVNLRPPFVDRSVVQTSLEAADFVKLNEDELEEMSGWFGWPGGMRTAVDALADAFGCRLVCVTRGDAGAVLWHEGVWAEQAGLPITVRDTVGAGDAFLAGLLAGLLDGCGDEVALDIACHLGAFVASKSGATPNYVVTTLGEVASFAR